MPISDNPDVTSGVASTPATQLKFPASEVMPFTTKLRFVEYNRLTGWKEGTETVKSVITLPLPLQVPNNISMKLSQHDMERWGNLSPEALSQLSDARPMEAVSKGIDHTIDTIKAGIANVRANAIKGAAVAPSIAGMGGGDLQRNAQILGGAIVNPHTTLAFEGVNLKSFFLEWRLSPRSLAESQTLQRIVEEIEYRTHPEEIFNGFALNYPDVCYVEFTGEVKKYLPKFQKAFISNINITPDAPGGLALFKSGAPVAINLQLSLQELSIVTRQTIDARRGTNV